MKTEHLVQLLATDAGYRSPAVAPRLTLALIGGYALSFVLFMATLGPRPYAMQSAMDNAFFDLKFVVVLTLAMAAIVLALIFTRPEVRTSRYRWLLLVPLALIAIGIVFDIALFSADGWRTRLVGSNAMVCLTAIPFLSVPLLAGVLLALRHGATSRPALTGALAGLVSAGLAASLYASHCTDDSPLFVATWYTIAIGIVTLVGAALGNRFLRF